MPSVMICFTSPHPSSFLPFIHFSFTLLSCSFPPPTLYLSLLSSSFSLCHISFAPFSPILSRILLFFLLASAFLFFLFPQISSLFSPLHLFSTLQVSLSYTITPNESSSNHLQPAINICVVRSLLGLDQLEKKQPSAPAKSLSLETRNSGINVVSHFTPRSPRPVTLRISDQYRLLVLAWSTAVTLGSGLALIF